MDDENVGGKMGGEWIDGQLGRWWREACMNTDGQPSQLSAFLFCLQNLP